MNGFISFSRSVVAGNRLLRRVTSVLLAVVIVASFVRTIGKDPTDFQILDFGAYYRGATAVATGNSPYVVDEYWPDGNFVYAPIYAYLFLPVASLEYLWGSALWTSLNWGLAFFCVVGSWRLVQGDRQDGRGWETDWLALLPLIVSFNWTIRQGQAGILMAALCIGWALCQRRRCPILGGILLSFAAALKIMPGALFVLVLVRRDWRGLIGGLLGVCLLIGVPALQVGLNGSVQMHLDWLDFAKDSQAGQTIRLANQSLLATLARLPWISNSEVLYSPEHLNDLLAFYPKLLIVLCVLLMGWIAYQWRHPRILSSARREYRDTLEFAFVLVFITLAHPRGWRYNFVALILPCMLLADWAIRRERGWRWSLAALLTFFVIGLLPRMIIRDDAWSLWGWLWQAKDFWAIVGLGAACVLRITLERNRHESSPPANESRARTTPAELAYS